MFRGEEEMAEPTEVSFYNKSNVQITNTRAILRGITFAMANITSYDSTTGS